MEFPQTEVLKNFQKQNAQCKLRVLFIFWKNWKAELQPFPPRARGDKANRSSG
jgi:hypothetical protein